MYARRIDNTQRQLVSELRQAGFTVRYLFRLNDDGPDLLIGRNGLDAQVECKTPTSRTGRIVVSDGQRTFADGWKGSPVIVASTLDQVLFAWSQLVKRLR